jgi:hypothetical protein
MDMDEQLLPQLRWCLQVQVGEGIRIIPRDNEALCVTDVFLVDPESADGLGVVAAYAEMGTRKLMLAELSSEVTDVELPTPEVMDEEFCFYVMRQGADSDADNDAGVVAVQFEGFVRSLPSSDTNEELEVEEDGDEDEDAAGSDDDDDRIEEDNEEDGETDTTGKNVAAVRRDIAVCDSHGKKIFAGRRKKIRTAKKNRTAKND